MAASTKVYSNQGTFTGSYVLSASGAVPGDYGIGVLLVPSTETGGLSGTSFTGGYTLLGTFAGYKVYWFYVATEMADWLGTGSAASLTTTGGTAMFGYSVFHNPDGFLPPHSDPSGSMESASAAIPTSLTVSADDSDTYQSVNLAVYIGTLSQEWSVFYVTDPHGMTRGFEVLMDPVSFSAYWSEDFGEPAQTVEVNQPGIPDDLPDSFRMFRISLRVNTPTPTPPGAPKLRLEKVQITELPYQVHTRMV